MSAEPSWDHTPTWPLPVVPYLGDADQYWQDPGWYGQYGQIPGGPPVVTRPARPARQARPAGRRTVRGRAPGRRWFTRIFVLLLGFVLFAALALSGLLVLTPPVSDAQARARALDARHHVVFPGPVPPARFTAALIATEDHRFYHEPGIDPFAIARFAWGRLTGQPDQGGATLYMQLAKMLYTPGQTGMLSKAEQVGLGIKLDFAYSKAQILAMYAAVAYFGHGYYGLAAASCGYFGVTPGRLGWPQAALLAGLVQAPSADDPLTHLTAARARQAHVLSRLVATGVLTQAQAARAFRAPLHLVNSASPRCAP